MSQSPEATTIEPSTLPRPLPRHPYEVLAKHWGEVVESYRFASHLFDSDVHSVSESSTCAWCKLFAQSPIIADTDESELSHFAMYTVNLLGERERLDASNYSPGSYATGAHDQRG